MLQKLRIRIILCFLTGASGIFLVIQDNLIFVAIGTSLLATFIFIALDTGVSSVFHLSAVDALRDFHRVKIFSTNDEAFRHIFRKFREEKIHSLKMLTYTADMETRNLQRLIRDAGIKVGRVSILVKDPETLAEIITVNEHNYPGFPANEEMRNNRSGEFEHALTELKGLIDGGFAESIEVRYYYSLPAIRATIMDEKIGYMSIYQRHTSGGDLSGSTNVYIQLSKRRSRIEKELLEDVLEWFEIAWEAGRRVQIDGEE